MRSVPTAVVSAAGLVAGLVFSAFTANVMAGNPPPLPLNYCGQFPNCNEVCPNNQSCVRVQTSITGGIPNGYCGCYTLTP